MVRVAEPGTGGEMLTPMRGGGGNSVTSSVNVTFAPVINVANANEEQVASKFLDALSRDLDGIKQTIRDEAVSAVSG